MIQQVESINLERYKLFNCLSHSFLYNIKYYLRNYLSDEFINNKICLIIEISLKDFCK